MDLPYLNVSFTPNHDENLSNLIASIWCVFNLKSHRVFGFSGLFLRYHLVCLAFFLRARAFLK